MPASGTTRGQLNEAHMAKRTIRFDERIVAVMAGMGADARVLAQKAQVECQSYRLTMGEPCSVNYLARHISKIQQKYTITGGRRPFGVTLAIGGFEQNASVLYTCDPAGTVIPYTKIAIGGNSNNNGGMKEYLANNENPKEPTTEALMRYVAKAMLDSVDPSH